MNKSASIPKKHVFITGGVVSSLGKGITAASIGLLLSRRGYRVRLQKMDPYLNVDPGTMSPYQHGEVYVTDDGTEADLDLGHYERIAGVTCARNSNFTTGRIYSTVINREREGGYLGKTVQVIPHVTDEIKNAVRSAADDETDIVITEIGGTAGDIESLPFLEAIRQFRHEIGRNNGVFIHLTLVPFIKAAGEFKTKPAQQSAGILRAIGIIPDILICRCEKRLEQAHKEKLALFSNVAKDLVIEEPDVRHSIYEVPVDLAEQGLDVYILEMLGLHVKPLRIEDWKQMLSAHFHPENGEVEIAVVGKYISLRDAYKSVYEALIHGGIANKLRVNIRMVEAEKIENGSVQKLIGNVHGILVPGGFGDRGIAGKIQAVQYARENKIPFFGICLGMQCAVMEFARNVCGLADANSTEFAPAAGTAVIDLMEEQKKISAKGGTMRLGAYPCALTPGTKSRAAYGTDNIQERHRHRYEFNNIFREKLEQKGMVVAGVCPEGQLVEIVELKDHPWFVGCQFHPEFKSGPLKAHPLFREFAAAAMRKAKK
ncbi:MAG: CTP synthase [Kiritimatiellae bacterium]|nr:CTP synthase [Kiritimatiellia bacterium]